MASKDHRRLTVDQTLISEDLIKDPMVMMSGESNGLDMRQNKRCLGKEDWTVTIFRLPKDDDLGRLNSQDLGRSNS
jgi:hypothetical protein